TLERDRWILRNIEKVWRAKVLVPLRISRDQGRNIDRGFDRRIIRVLACVDNAARNARESTFYVRDHHMSNAEFRHAVGRIDVPDRPFPGLGSCSARCGGRPQESHGGVYAPT